MRQIDRNGERIRPGESETKMGLAKKLLTASELTDKCANIFLSWDGGHQA
jgi:hypothetical protein